ncbi:hypothetical protein CR513_32061, partial [Mucuna pruriens]
MGRAGHIIRVVEFRTKHLRRILHFLSCVFYSHGGARCFQWCLSRLRKRRSRIERPKVVRGDRMTCHRTLVDLILSVLANGVQNRVNPTLLRQFALSRDRVSFDNSSPVTNTSDSVEYSSTNNFAKPEQMENNDRTPKELAT